MTIVQYYEMLPINGKLISNEVYELCNDNFTVIRTIDHKEATRLIQHCKVIRAEKNTIIYRQHLVS